MVEGVKYYLSLSESSKEIRQRNKKFCSRWEIPLPFIFSLFIIGSVDTWDFLCIHNNISQFSEHAMAIDLDNAIAVTAIGRHSKFKK